MDPQARANPGPSRTRFSGAAVVAFVLSSVAPILLCVGDWAFVSYIPGETNSLSLIETLINVVVAATPLAGAVLGIVVVVTIRRKGRAGRGLAIASIAVGFTIAFILPVYFAALLLQYFQVNQIG